MSAANFPILDAKNIQRGGISVPDRQTGFIHEWGYPFDPVAKLFFLYNPHNHGDMFMWLKFWPEMSENALMQALLDGDPARPLRESAILVQTIVSRQMGYKRGFRRGSEILAEDTLFCCFSSSSTNRLDDKPWRDRSDRLSADVSPGYDFWPAGRPGRGTAVATYLVHAAMLDLEWFVRNSLVPATLKHDVWKPERIAVSVTPEILERLGSQNFPECYRLADGSWSILEKAVGHLFSSSD